MPQLRPPRCRPGMPSYGCRGAWGWGAGQHGEGPGVAELHVPTLAPALGLAFGAGRAQVKLGRHQGCP